MKINHVTILVKDKEKSKKFYTDILGFEKVEKDGRLWIKIGKQFIHISDNSGAPIKNTFYHFGIEIKGLRKFINRLRDKEIKIFDIDFKPAKKEIDISRNYFIRDIDGNLLEFIEKNNLFFNPKSKTGEKIVKLFGAAILLLVLGFGGYAYAFNKDDNAEWPPRTRRIYLNYGLVTALFDMRGQEKVEIETLKNDFDGDDVSEDIKFLELRYRDPDDVGYAYITRVISEKDSFDINGVFVSAEAIDLNKDGKNELVVTVIENKLYNMVLMNYTDGKLRSFPVFDTTGEYFNGIWSKFKIELQDFVNSPARIITSVPEYTGDYCEWKDMLKYYKWNGVGFEYYDDGERSMFSLDYCEDEPANGLIKVSGVEFE